MQLLQTTAQLAVNVFRVSSLLSSKARDCMHYADVQHVRLRFKHSGLCLKADCNSAARWRETVKVSTEASSSCSDSRALSGGDRFLLDLIHRIPAASWWLWMLHGATLLKVGVCRTCARVREGIGWYKNVFVFFFFLNHVVVFFNSSVSKSNSQASRLLLFHLIG